MSGKSEDYLRRFGEGRRVLHHGPDPQSFGGERDAEARLPIPVAELDLELGWRRSIADLASRRAFARHPFLDALIGTDLASWLSALTRDLERGEFRPAACPTIPVPKPLGHIRPGGELQLADLVIYSALVQHMRPFVTASLGEAATSRDYSYHLRTDINHVDWFESFFPRWRAFDRDSVEAIDEGAEYVVVADVAGFYENIDLNILRSDLNGLGVDALVLNQLMECLHRWPRIQRRGVPQGYSPSDLLAKLYLHAVDLTLIADGFQHRRWVDDFRIFCTSEAEARRALVALSVALGRRGLVLQTAKTRVLAGLEARQRFDEVPALLTPIQIAVAQQLGSAEGAGGSDLPTWALDDALAAPEAEGAVEVLRTAFETYFLRGDHPFNKSLFHYLLRRLAAAGDRTHVGGIVALFRRFPEELDSIAEYCQTVGASEFFETDFIEVWGLQLLPYPYCAYQFLRWRVRDDRALSATLRTIGRGFAFEPGHSWYVRAASRALLGKLGDGSDLERLEAAYAHAESQIEKAELLCALQRMEPGRRNALFGRAAGDGDLPSKAVRVARAGGVRWEAC